MCFKLLQPRLNYTLSFKERMVVLRSILFGYKLRNNTLKEIFSTNDIFYFDHARTGLQFVLSLLPKQSRVGVQPFTCHTVLEAIENAECKVVFVDINDQLVVDNQTLQQRIDEIDVLIVTHTFGYPVDVLELKKKLPGKIIIQDCCHAFLSKYNGNVVGRIGDFSLFSYGFAKFPSAIRGGYVIVNSSKYIDKFHQQYDKLSTSTLKRELSILFTSVIATTFYFPFVYTFLSSKIKERRRNLYYFKKASGMKIYKESSATHSLFDLQLLTINEKLEIQQQNANRIMEVLQKNSAFTVCQLSQESNFFMIPAYVNNPSRFIEFAKIRGVEIGQHFVQSINVIPSFGYQTGDCENYERLIQKLVTFPSHYNYPACKLNLLLSIIEAYTNE